jgi:hypothetical protein
MLIYYVMRERRLILCVNKLGKFKNSANSKASSTRPMIFKNSNELTHKFFFQFQMASSNRTRRKLKNHHVALFLVSLINLVNLIVGSPVFSHSLQLSQCKYFILSPLLYLC